ncbi:MAG: LysM peptidoglycan-binding domain-containing protein, partial [Bacillota bacterium]|nr:LysM peptidoglycan-binding domain-containing protein [Bacillota bacterium]
MQNSTTATYPFTESALVKRPLPARIRGTRRRYAAIYKAKKNRFIYNTGLVAGGLPLILKLKKHFSAFALSVSSVWHFLLRCFFYIVIVFCRIFPIAAAPFVRVVKAASPSLREVWRKFIHWKDTFLHSPMGRIPAVAMIGVFTAMILSVNYFGLGLEVSIDGENVGYVSDQEEVDSVIRSVENRSAFYLNHPYSLNVNVGYKLKLMDRSKIINPMELEEKLFTKVNEVSNLYVLKVNGNLIGANASKTAIDLVLDKILKQYETGEPNVKTQFVQDVSVTEMPVANAFLKTPDELMSILKGQEQPKSASPQKNPSTSGPGTYVVKGGDTASGIAKKNNISLRELKKANPDFNPDKLSIGQKLNLPYGASEIESPSGSASSQAGS